MGSAEDSERYRTSRGTPVLAIWNAGGFNLAR